MATHLYFVDGIQPDKTSKRLMRSHVMKGKNAGKKLHRRSRLGLQNRQPDIGPSKESSIGYENDNNRESWSDDRRFIPASIPQCCENSFPTFAFPVPVSQASKEIIHDFFGFVADRLYPAYLGISIDKSKLMWFQVLFTDETTYHCSVGLMQACNEMFLSNGNSPPSALYHLSRTFTQLNERLCSGRAVAISDGTIAIVLSLILQEQIRRESAAVVHFQGLEQMVRLRGGLKQLEANLALVHKICKTDIVFALHNGGPTIFFRDCMPELGKVLVSEGLSSKCSSTGCSVRLSGMDMPLQQVLLDTMSVCALVNNSSHKFTHGLEMFGEIVISICYRLLRFRSLNESRRLSDRQSVIHIGLIIFMMTTFLQRNGRQIVDFSLINLSLRDILNSQMDEHENDFVLWFIMMCGIWTSQEFDGELLSLRTRSSGQALGIDTWSGVQSCVSKFPWINALHDEPGRGAWTRLQSYHSTQ